MSQYEYELVKAEDALFWAKKDLKREEADPGDRIERMILKSKVSQADTWVLKTEAALFHIRREMKLVEAEDDRALYQAKKQTPVIQRC